MMTDRILDLGYVLRRGAFAAVVNSRTARGMAETFFAIDRKVKQT